MTPHRWLGVLGVGLASLVASILLPSAVITVYALSSRRAAEISELAIRGAEPLALAGATMAVITGSLLVTRRSARPRLVGSIAGAIASAFIAGAAFLVGDVDTWTLGSAVLLPAAGALAGWCNRQRAWPAAAAITSRAREPHALGQPAPQLRQEDQARRSAIRT